MPTQKVGVKTSALVLVSNQQVELLLRQSVPLRAENQRLVQQARTEIAKLRAACSLTESEGSSALERSGNGVQLP